MAGGTIDSRSGFEPFPFPASFSEMIGLGVMAARKTDQVTTKGSYLLFINSLMYSNMGVLPV